jgi:hypothetical protein
VLLWIFLARSNARILIAIDHSSNTPALSDYKSYRSAAVVYSD